MLRHVSVNIILQIRGRACRYPERDQQGTLAEYCYYIEAEVTSNSKLTTVRTAENIAMVLSALINSGGGVLVVGLVTQARDIHLDACQEDIFIHIAKQEKWIPEGVFTDTISCTKNEPKKEIYFFASKAPQLVTHNSNAYYLIQRNPERIVENDVLIGMLRTCTCENDAVCEKHKGLATKNQIVSTLANAEALTVNQLLSVPQSDETYFYRNYGLNNRSLCDVLSTQSVQCEMLELVSALANTKGGSIFLGVTNTATPTVEGYRLNENDETITANRISDILAGTNPGSVTISGEGSGGSRLYWKIFLHNVVGSDTVKKVIEIRVEKCPGGMFCALPICLDIGYSGEIYQLNSFAEWKKRLGQCTTESRKDEESDSYHKHFESRESTDQDTSPGFNMQPEETLLAATRSKKEAVSSSEFCWWRSDAVPAESLQFDKCCSKELAEGQMNIFAKFSTFPPLEAVIERHNGIAHLEDTLKKIFQEHQSHAGVAVIMENVPDCTLPIYASLKDLTPVYHVFDVVLLKEKLPPLIVSIFNAGCPEAEAKKYCLTLGQLLKRHCSQIVDSQNTSMKLFFRCQLCFLGEGYKYLQDEGCYPKDYMSPSTQTINTVRYALARILLDCKPYITDRYGNVMVKHLSYYQAKFLLERRSKVMIVAAKAGSGKTVLALEMARRIKKRHGNRRKVVFFCRSRGLAAFVKSQTKGMEIFETVQECNIKSIAEVTIDTFNRYTDVIIDDAHAIPVHGEPNTWQMYCSLFCSLQKRQTHAYIFLDPDMQDYRGCIPENFVRQLRTLAEQYVTEYEVTIERLDKILRNSRRICQFMKTSMDSMKMEELATVRQIPEDGVFFYNILGRDENQDEEATLMSQLQNMLRRHTRENRYCKKDITILTDNSEDKAWVKESLKGKYATADSTQFPVKSIVVDTLENFEGLESPVILFIIPRSWGTGYVGSVKYRLCVVTRAISRLEFLLPWDPSSRQQDLAELKKAFSSAVRTFNAYMFTGNLDTSRIVSK